MSNEYKDWLMDRANGVACIMNELHKYFTIIVNNSQSADRVSSDAYDCLEYINNVFKEDGYALEMFGNNEFNVNMLPLLHTLEEFISAKAYPILLVIKEENHDEDIRATAELGLRCIRTFYSDNEIKEINEQTNNGEVYS